MSVVFIGMPATGKSKVGKRIADAFQATFADTDALFEEKYGSIKNYVSRHGEGAFRQLEKDIVIEAIGKYDVISLGGGSVLDPGVQKELSTKSATAKKHTVILLDVTPEAAEPRLKNSNRPNVSDIEAWQDIYERRKNIYARLADKKFDTSVAPVWQVVMDIRSYLERY